MGLSPEVLALLVSAVLVPIHMVVITVLRRIRITKNFEAACRTLELQSREGAFVGDVSGQPVSAKLMNISSAMAVSATQQRLHALGVGLAATQSLSIAQQMATETTGTHRQLWLGAQLTNSKDHYFLQRGDDPSDTNLEPGSSELHRLLFVDLELRDFQELRIEGGMVLFRMDVGYQSWVTQDWVESKLRWCVSIAEAFEQKYGDAPA